MPQVLGARESVPINRSSPLGGHVPVDHGRGLTWPGAVVLVDHVVVAVRPAAACPVGVCQVGVIGREAGVGVVEFGGIH